MLYQILIPGGIGIWRFWFLRRGEKRSTRRKTSRSKLNCAVLCCAISYNVG